ncbi:hypothetical protein WP50_20820, partial [Lactiplantibacillus plantarum]
KMKEHLIEDREQAAQAKAVAKIHLAVPTDVQLEDLVDDGPVIDKLAAFYQKMDFQSFLKKLHLQSDEPAW